MPVHESNQQIPRTAVGRVGSKDDLASSSFKLVGACSSRKRCNEGRQGEQQPQGKRLRVQSSAEQPRSYSLDLSDKRITSANEADHVSHPSELSHFLVERAAAQLSLPVWQVRHAALLLHEGNTIPFIARYRKEKTGQLDEVQLRKLQDCLRKLQALEARRQAILNSLKQQGVKDATVLNEVQKAGSLASLEDLYLPFKPKRSTRASAAQEKGLQQLVDIVLTRADSSADPKELARPFVGKKVGSVEEALAGVNDIIAQRVSDLHHIRQQAQVKARQGTLVSKASKKAKDQLNQPQTSSAANGNSKVSSKQNGAEKKPKVPGPTKAGQGKTTSANDPPTYRQYFDFQSRVPSIRSHQVMALNRGESLGLLTIKLEWRPEELAHACWTALLPSKTGHGRCAACIRGAISDGLTRLLKPAIDRMVRSELTERATEEAIAAFASNLKSILLAPPLKCGTVLGVDPGFRNGCKMAVCSSTGAVLETAVMYPHTAGQEKAAEQLLKGVLTRHKVAAVALGDGVGSHQTEQFISRMLQGQQPHNNKSGPGVGWVVVSEAGASIYSASPLAAEELPDLDVTLRGAVSIARRLLDPLAELVKVEPHHLGVGMYQHDIKAGLLADELGSVVECAVNSVGVELNTASPVLLTHVAGLNSGLARRLVELRNKNGPFQSRQELLQVKGLGPKIFEQCAGFLRVHEAANALDATAVHPESYQAAVQFVHQLLDGQTSKGPPTLTHSKKTKSSSREPYSKSGGSSKQQAGHAAARLDWDMLQAAKPLLEQLPHKAGAEQLQSFAKDLGVGVATLTDIAASLCCPERDIRGAAPPSILRSSVGRVEDLQVGQEVAGVVRNVVAFGAFVDVNVGRDGLIPAASMRQRTLQPGEKVTVKVLQVELDRKRITLSL